HGELNASRAAELEQGVDRSANRAPRIEDVVDEDDGQTLEREGDARGAPDRLATRSPPAVADVDVVAVKGDVQRAHGQVHPAPLLDEAPEPRCEGRTPRLDADERDPLETGTGRRGAPLDDLVRDARERFRC